MESMCGLLLGSLVTADAQIGPILTSRLKISPMVDIIGAPVSLKCHDESVREQWRTLAQRIGAAARRRNTLVHSRWAVGGRGGLKMRLQTKAVSKRGLELKWGLENVAAIDQAAAEVEGCIAALAIFAELSRPYQLRTIAPAARPYSYVLPTPQRT